MTGEYRGLDGQSGAGDCCFLLGANCKAICTFLIGLFFLNNIVSLFKAAALDFTYFLLYFYFEKVTSAYLSFLFGVWNRVSCSPGWFCTCSVAEDDLYFPLPPKWCLHAWPLFALFASIFSQLELKASLSHY